MPGVERVAGLHVWAMGTSENALTAHLVMPDGLPSDAFYGDAERELHDRFGIEHVTLQPVSVSFTAPCAATLQVNGSGSQLGPERFRRAVS
ncbi:MAG TPA: hypothetical protein VF958_08530 [Thermoanaerobaculia bacterium]